MRLKFAVAGLVALACLRGVIASPYPPSQGVSTHIVGGVSVRLGEIPWQISIFKSSVGEHICGGSILNDMWILTAAHCVKNALATDLIVNAGFVYMNKPGFQRQSVGIDTIIYHELYDSNLGTFGGNDIALLKLASRLNLNVFVSSIALPHQDYVASGTGLISGWGSTEENGNLSNTLNSVELPVLSLLDCQDLYGDDMTEQMLCAGFMEGGKDACQGDSGGPMVCQSDAVVCGVVAAGDGCARENTPGVYTNVAYYIDWLQENMNETVAT